MARHPRIDLPGVAQHVVQRGNNRLPCFLDDDDRARYLRCLQQALLRYEVELHAYVLMSNHVHLLVTPVRPRGLSWMMQALGRNYAGLFNGRHGRTGTLWEGRYKACLVDTEHYLLACYRYIEFNPVRAWMVDDPAAYVWSSHRANALGQPDSAVTPHPVYLALGANVPSRTQAYRASCREALPDPLLAEIRQYLQQQRALGNDRFRATVEAKVQRFMGTRPGLPPKGTQRVGTHHHSASSTSRAPYEE